MISPLVLIEPILFCRSTDHWRACAATCRRPFHLHSPAPPC